MTDFLDLLTAFVAFVGACILGFVDACIGVFMLAGFTGGPLWLALLLWSM